MAAGRIYGPLSAELLDKIHISRFGVIPKPHQPGKWRLISDLSSPAGVSVNDEVDSQLCSLSYASVDEAVCCIRRIGRGAALAKFDIASAYRIVPITPSRPLAARHDMERLTLRRWSLTIWSEISSQTVHGGRGLGCYGFPLWIMGRHGITEALHYLDDFLLIGASGGQQCADALKESLRLCEALGVPIAPHKVVGPTTALPFLGILIDTEECMLKLPTDKLLRLKRVIGQWQGKKSCKKRDLLSLIGQLSHACRVVRAGRTFLRRMIDLPLVPKELHHWVRLSKGFQSDLHWWAIFMDGWNGVSMFDSTIPSPPFATLTSDASGGWGCGAFTSTGEWFQFRWPPAWDHIHITAKELLPIVVACAVWGHRLRGKTILC